MRIEEPSGPIQFHKWPSGGGGGSVLRFLELFSCRPYSEHLTYVIMLMNKLCVTCISCKVILGKSGPLNYTTLKDLPIILRDFEQPFGFYMSLRCSKLISLNCEGAKQARKPRSYARSNLWLTGSLTGVKCSRATSVATNVYLFNCMRSIV